VGHQPTLGHVAALLMSGTDMDWSVRKGAVIWIENRARGGGEEAVLRAVMTPEML
jgi:phosphohistidine phosphatase